MMLVMLIGVNVLREVCLYYDLLFSQVSCNSTRKFVNKYYI